MKPRRSITRFIFDKQPATFRSDFDLQESIKRLSGEVKRNAWQSLFRESLMGRVQEKNVVIMRLVPFVNNSFAPVFQGQFSVQNGVTVLEGYFAMTKATRLFIGFYFGFGLFMAFLFPISSFDNKPIATNQPMPQWQAQLMMILIPFGLLIWGALLLSLGKWMGRKDAAVISGKIEKIMHS